MNAVIYARYSSAGQKDVSIDDQIKVCREYAARNYISVLSCYADHARSGTNDNRPEFLRLVRDSKKRAFDVVLIYKQDRFARNRYDAVVYKKKLRDNGAKVISVMEPIPEGSAGIILEAIYESSSESFVENLKENVNRGMDSNADNCFANGHPPYGYQIERTTKKNHKFIIDEKKAPIVKEIYTMAAMDISNKEILHRLALRGIKKGTAWLYDLLCNRRYMGIYISRGREIVGGMPQIVSKETFDKVRSIMAKRKIRPRAVGATYALSGKVFCGNCNSRMNGQYGTSSNSKGRRYRYYYCVNHKYNKGCQSPAINADCLEESVLIKVKELLNDSEFIRNTVKAVIDYQKSLTNNSPILDIKKELSSTEKKLANVANAIEQGIITPTTKERLLTLESQCNELKLLLQEKKLEANTSVTEKEVTEFLLQYRSGNINDKEYAKTLIDKFVDKIIIEDKGHGYLICNATGEKKSLTFTCQGVPYTYESQTFLNGFIIIPIEIKALS